MTRHARTPVERLLQLVPPEPSSARECGCVALAPCSVAGAAAGSFVAVGAAAGSCSAAGAAAGIEWNYTYTYNYTFILIPIIIPIIIPDPGVIICIIPRWYNYSVIIPIIIPPNRIPKYNSTVE